MRGAALVGRARVRARRLGPPLRDLGGGARAAARARRRARRGARDRDRGDRRPRRGPERAAARPAGRGGRRASGSPIPPGSASGIVTFVLEGEDAAAHPGTARRGRLPHRRRPASHGLWDLAPARARRRRPRLLPRLQRRGRRRRARSTRPARHRGAPGRRHGRSPRPAPPAAAPAVALRRRRRRRRGPRPQRRLEPGPARQLGAAAGAGPDRPRRRLLARGDADDPARLPLAGLGRAGRPRLPRLGGAGGGGRASAVDHHRRASTRTRGARAACAGPDASAVDAATAGDLSRRCGSTTTSRSSTTRPRGCSTPTGAMAPCCALGREAGVELRDAAPAARLDRG